MTQIGLGFVRRCAGFCSPDPPLGSSADDCKNREQCCFVFVRIFVRGGLQANSSSCWSEKISFKPGNYTGASSVWDCALTSGTRI